MITPIGATIAAMSRESTKIFRIKYHLCLPIDPASFSKSEPSSAPPAVVMLLDATAVVGSICQIVSGTDRITLSTKKLVE